MRTLNFMFRFLELRRISLAISCFRYMNATFQQVILFIIDRLFAKREFPLQPQVIPLFLATVLFVTSTL